MPNRSEHGDHARGCCGTGRCPSRRAARRPAARCWWSAAPGSPRARCCWPGWPRCGPAPGVLQLAVAESHRGRAEHRGARGQGGRPARDRRRVGPGRSGDLLELAADADVIAVGPGLDDIDARPRSCCARSSTRRGKDTAVVLDAYALGALSQTPDLLAGRSRPVVLTPNLAEAAAPARPRSRRRPGRGGGRAGPAATTPWSPSTATSPRPTAGAGARRAATPGWAPPAAATCAPGSWPGCWAGAPTGPGGLLGRLRARGQRPAAGPPVRPDRLPRPGTARRGGAHDRHGLEVSTEPCRDLDALSSRRVSNHAPSQPVSTVFIGNAGLRPSTLGLGVSSMAEPGPVVLDAQAVVDTDVTGQYGRQQPSHSSLFPESADHLVTLIARAAQAPAATIHVLEDDGLRLVAASGLTARGVCAPMTRRRTWAVR